MVQHRVELGLFSPERLGIVDLGLHSIAAVRKKQGWRGDSLPATTVCTARGVREGEEMSRHFFKAEAHYTGAGEHRG